MSSRKKRNIIISILVCFLVFVTVGYALLRQDIKLAITGRLDGVWDIYISNITLKSYTGRAKEAEKASISNKVNANFEVDLYMPGDSVEYEVTVKNDGNIDATLRSITTSATNTSEDIRFTHTIKQGEVLKKESETTFIFKIEFDQRATSLPDTQEPIQVSMKLDYLQNTGNQNYVPVNFETDNTCFSYNSNGVITKYDYSCGNEVSIPKEIDEVKITGISNDAFIASDSSKPLTAINMMDADFLTTFKFNDFTNLAHVTLPNELINIPASAFENCPITTISLPNKLQTIGNYAFKNTDLTGSLYLPDTLTTIGVSTFEGTNLSGVLTLPDKLVTISNNAFNGNKFTKLQMSKNSNVKTIGNNAFKDNQISNAITLPKTLTTIGNSAFVNNKISSLALNYGLESIGNYAFQSNEITGSINIPVTVKSINIGAFQNNQITRVIFNKNSALTTLGTYVFNNNNIAGEIMIPKNLERIERATFQTNNISSLVFESGSKLKVIDHSAFRNNSITKSLEIPSSVTTIGFWAFNQALNINSLTFGENSSLTLISEAAFANNTIKSVVIPASVVTISSGGQGGAFSMAGIEELTFEENSSLETIASRAFQSNLIESVIIPKSVKTIDTNAFNQCQLESVEFEANSVLTTIGSNAFSINNLTTDGLGPLPSTLTTLATNAFNGNPTLTQIVLTTPTDLDGWPDGGTIDVGRGAIKLATIVYQR